MRVACCISICFFFLASYAQAGSALSEDKDSYIEELRRLLDEATESARSMFEEVFGEEHSDKPTPPLRLGITVDSVPRLLRSHLELPDGVGLLVGQVYPASPAEKAGLMKDDILLGYEDQILINFEQLQVLLQLAEPGAEVEFRVLRKGLEKTIIIELTNAELAKDAANGTNG